MGKIKVLDSKIINLIAAGEVVERPASVVKELVENSIDAGATKIVVQVTNGGMDNITIIDNGSGMEQSDAELAFTQHATSKISSASDLDHILTLGFRGEALASISSVSEVTLDTKTPSGPAVRILATANGTESTISTKTTSGTTIVVQDLFKAIPARRKFLRSPQTEFGHIQDALTSLSLINLPIHFELYHNQKLIWRLPPTPKFTERVANLWSAETAESLYALEAPIPGGSMQIYLGKPESGRKDRKLQYLFINHRYVTERAIQKAVMDAYLGFLPRELYPIYFLILDLDPQVVDVNVHPRKLEVRLDNAGQLFGAVKQQVANFLQSQTKQDILTRISAVAPREIPDTTTATHTPNIHPIPNTSYQQPTTRHPSSDTRYPRPHINQSLSFTQNLLADVPSKVTEPAAAMLQVFGTYIIYQQGESIVVIDQHAAAEKVLYEKLRKQHQATRSRPLLTPQVLNLSAKDKATALELQEQLHSLGIEIADFGGNSIQVTAVPELTPHIDVPRLIQSLSTKQDDKEYQIDEVGDITPEAHLLIATMACHGAIRAGQHLTTQEMQQLVRDLGECEFPYNCPHGRPVSWVMSRYELEKQFKRVI